MRTTLQILSWLTLFLLLGTTGCISHIQWAHEAEAIPPSSCVPDHPPTWNDFSRQDRSSPNTAQTAVRFRIAQLYPPRLEARFDPEQSWVIPEAIDSWDPYVWETSQMLLRHEQLHFAISCLLVRQANVVLQNGGNLQAMLELVRATAQRLNRQYDKDTRHGVDLSRQADWEQDVEQQLQEVTKLE